MNLNQIHTLLKNSLTKSVIKANVSRLLYKQDSKLIAELKAFSPKDTGEFASNWKAYRKKFGSGGVLAQIIVSNDTPNYGQFVAGGAEPGQAPWYYPHKKTGHKDTGKLMVSGGKVWAGGLNPGHDRTVGGPMTQVLSQYTGKLTQEFANDFVKGFL